MTEVGALRPQTTGHLALHAPTVLLVGSIALYVGVALWTGQTKMLETEGLVGLMQRMVALGIR